MSMRMSQPNQRIESKRSDRRSFNPSSTNHESLITSHLFSSTDHKPQATGHSFFRPSSTVLFSEGQRPVPYQPGATPQVDGSKASLGLKARHIRSLMCLTGLKNGTGLQPSKALDGRDLGRCPRLVWNGPLALKSKTLPLFSSTGHQPQATGHSCFHSSTTHSSPITSHFREHA